MSHYETLGVSQNATEKDIRQAKSDLCKKYHPDRNPLHKEKFEAIIEAFNVLGDKDKRRIYDANLTNFDSLANFFPTGTIGF